MGILQVIVVAYERAIPLRGLIDSFMVQTSPSWELHIIHDGKTPRDVSDIMALYNDKRINFYESETRNGKWGHPNRKKMLDRLEAGENDFVLLTNDDNYYTKNFVAEVMNNATKTIGMIHFDMLHSYYQWEVLKTKPKLNQIDMGAFIVRGTVAKKVGFNSMVFEADGMYCEACKRFCDANEFRTLYIPKIYFIHN